MSVVNLYVNESLGTLIISVSECRMRMLMLELTQARKKVKPARQALPSEDRSLSGLGKIFVAGRDLHEALLRAYKCLC